MHKTKTLDIDIEIELDQSKSISTFLSTVADTFSNPNSVVDMGINDWEGLSAILSVQTEKIANIKAALQADVTDNQSTLSNTNQSRKLEEILGANCYTNLSHDDPATQGVE